MDKCEKCMVGEQFLALAGKTAGAPTVREDFFAACCQSEVIVGSKVTETPSRNFTMMDSDGSGPMFFAFDNNAQALHELHELHDCDCA